MAEPINLAPVRVHAISVPMRPDPTQLHKFDEMMLQANGDDTVQADLFGTDPQGKPYHESRTFNEQEYEQLRKHFMTRELATLPPFSSFKSGNTIGRVVGETVPASVPATQANPPIETETEEEKGWWASASPWVHGSLDVLGFVPGLGAIPDLINAGIYAAEGDAVNASLSAVAAIPFAGDAIKGGVLVGKGARHLGAEVAQQAAHKTAKEATGQAEREASERLSKNVVERPMAGQSAAPKAEGGGKIKQRKTFDVECFNLPEGANEDEFIRQLKEQEDALNAMDADTLISRRKAIDDAGGTEALRDKKAQRKARKDYERKRLSDLLAQDVDASKAKKIVSTELKELAATHILDIIAGGNPSDVTMGDKRTNSSVGAQWKGRRSQSIEDHAKEMAKAGTGKEKMKVKLKKC
ncbi:MULTISPECIES: polymorphic toxin type 15 domain-containing protein [Pseudomonas]|uniref:Novel toxin 15 n=1 Tax=Pseudomonas salomonii TaxID=191391 RepID=A0A1H3V601_9PSED|nr:MULTISPECIES: polymorphic toxin type 15 domain-containing protein [Pseudomonas]NWF07193.1 hypothetical protein [Pseudomonas salomonii]CRM54185.1 hypothetical protein [Pseudomonas sp. 58 R 3]SDZ69621.1 Novel toxin 15 [Pseudomonas salomonii]